MTASRLVTALKVAALALFLAYMLFGAYAGP